MAGFRPYVSEKYGGSIHTIKGKAPASTVITEGDALTLTSGYYVLMASAGQCDGVAAQTIASQSAAGKEIAIYPPDLIFQVDTVTTAPVQATHVGTQIDITTATTGAFVVTPGSSTNDDFFVLGIVEKVNSGTPAIGDPVYGTFVDTNKNL